MGERYERGLCELSPQSTASTHTIIMNTQNSSAIKYWHAHDIASLPFVNFWLMLACYQIDHALTDNALAAEISLDPKTVRSWRRFIVNDAVLVKILDRIAANAASKSNTLKSLEQLVREQLALAQTVRLTVPVNRTDARLPTGRAFTDVVTRNIPTVITHWVRKFRDQDISTKEFRKTGRLGEIAWGNIDANDAAVNIANSLIRSYSRPQLDIYSETLRLQLLKVLGQVAQAEVQMAALRVLSILPAEQGVDSNRAGDLEHLKSKILDLSAQAIKVARAYEMKLLEEVAAAEKIDKEDAVHGRAPIAEFAAAAASQSFTENVSALMDCLVKLQLVTRQKRAYKELGYVVAQWGALR